jgi:MFS family permease
LGCDRDYGLAGESNAVAKADLEGNIVSTLQGGCFVGALAAFTLTDMFGRKWCLIGSAMLTLIGVIMQAAASHHLAPLYVGRFIAGMYTNPESAFLTVLC